MQERDNIPEITTKGVGWGGAVCSKVEIFNLILTINDGRSCRFQAENKKCFLMGC